MGDMMTDYKDPEETDEYWIGVWDFIRHALWKEKAEDWIFDSQYFIDCLAKIPDMMIDDLRFEFGKEDLALLAEKSLEKKIGG
jgi:hypothetical protein